MEGIDKMGITRSPGLEDIHPSLLKENARMQELICM